MECRLAIPGVEQSVCFYRAVAEETIRWIVSSDGSVLDWTVFHSGR